MTTDDESETEDNDDDSQVTKRKGPRKMSRNTISLWYRHFRDIIG